MNNENMEGQDMDNRTNIDDFLTVRGFGGGYWGGNGMGVNGPVFQHSVDDVKSKIGSEGQCNRDIFTGQLRNVFDAFENQTRANEFNRVCDKLSNIDSRNTDNQFRAELRTNDRIAALQAEVTQNAKDAALCCCKLEAQAEKNKAELSALIIKENSQTRNEILTDNLAQARAEIARLKSHGHHGG